MPIEVQGAQGCVAGACLQDESPPPTPAIRHSIAFERGSDRARFSRNNPGAVRPTGRDPMYIELGNVEAGSTFQLVNISKKPDASFEKDALELAPTGRDLPNRVAGIYLTREQMDELDLKAGDLYLLRAKDAAGNVSGFVRGELEPDDWATGRVDDVIDNQWVAMRGTQTNLLDGEAAWKNVILRAVNDARPPVVLEDRLVIETRTFSADELAAGKTIRAAAADIKQRTGVDGFTKAHLDALLADATLGDDVKSALKACKGDLFDKLDDACWMDRKDGIVGFGDIDAAVASNGTRVAVKGDFAMEPQATMSIQNQRTGKQYSAAVGDDSVYACLLDDMQAGDPLILQPVDHEGNRGQELRYTYAPRCEKGRAPVVNALGARLGGVI